MTSGFRSSISTGLSATPETQNKEVYYDLVKIYNAIRTLATAIDRNTGTTPPDPSIYASIVPQDTLVTQNGAGLICKAAVAISVGQLVTLKTNGGTGCLADLAGGATWNGDARGICTESGGIAAGAYGEITLLGLITNIGGLTVGTYYTSVTTAGNITPTKPVAAGKIEQAIGYAIGTNLLWLTPSPQVIQH